MDYLYSLVWKKEALTSRIMTMLVILYYRPCFTGLEFIYVLLKIILGFSSVNEFSYQ